MRTLRKIKDILKSNDGASMVLVSILAIVVLTAVIMLRITTSTLMASASKQLNQDQAYELAASMGESIDNLIDAGSLDIYSYTITDETGTQLISESDFEGLPDSSVVAVVKKLDNGGRMIEVTSTVGQASYVYTKEYR